MKKSKYALKSSNDLEKELLRSRKEKLKTILLNKENSDEDSNLQSTLRNLAKEQQEFQQLQEK